VTKIKIQNGGTSGQKNASDLGKQYKYGYFQALIVEILHGILLATIWFYLKKNYLY
jgi:predicted nucleic acid-binding protein